MHYLTPLGYRVVEVHDEKFNIFNPYRLGGELVFERATLAEAEQYVESPAAEWQPLEGGPLGVPR
jgi:hypothetical protein